MSATTRAGGRSSPSIASRRWWRRSPSGPSPATSTAIPRACGCAPPTSAAIRRASSGCSWSSYCRGTSAEGRTDVDHAVVVERHERRADRNDHPLDVGEDFLVVARRDLDPDLVDGLRLEAALAQLVQQPVAIRDAC